MRPPANISLFQQVRNCPKNDKDMSKGHRNQHPTDQTWDNLSIKMNNNNPLNNFKNSGDHSNKN